MKKLIILLTLISSLGFSQNLNAYKYALVPSKFKFLKEADEFRLNTLTKMLMEKYGFESFFDSDILPVNFANDNCNKVFVEVLENNTLMSTRLKVVLKDCRNTVIFETQEGKSREKEYKVGYTQALREAFRSFDALNHKYDENLSTPKNVEVKVETKEVVVSSDLKDALVNGGVVVTNNEANQLFAQPIANGFQLINSEPKIVCKIFKTSTKDFYIATKGTLQGIFFKRNNDYFFEFYQNEKLISEKVEVKF